MIETDRPYFFLRPLLAADCGWVALDWHAGDPLTTKSIDLKRYFIESGAAPLASMLPLVTPIDPEYLEDNTFLDGFDNRQVVFVLPASYACVWIGQIFSIMFRLPHLTRFALMRHLPARNSQRLTSLTPRTPGSGKSRPRSIRMKCSAGCLGRGLTGMTVSF